MKKEKELVQHYCKEKPLFIATIHYETDTIPVFMSVVEKGIKEGHPYIYLKLNAEDKETGMPLYPGIFRIACTEEIKKYPVFQLDAYQVPIEDLEKIESDENLG